MRTSSSSSSQLAARSRHRAPEAGCARSPPSPSARGRCAMRADLDQRAADHDRLGQQMRQHLARDRAGRDARARSRAPRNARRRDSRGCRILGPIGVVGMAGAELVLDLAVILAALILVLDHQRDRRAGGLALEHAGEDLAPCPASRRWVTKRDWPGLRLSSQGWMSRFGQRDARRRAVDHAADRRPVAFAPGGEAEQMAEGVVRHRRAAVRTCALRSWSASRRARRPRPGASCRRRCSRCRRDGSRR